MVHLMHNHNRGCIEFQSDTESKIENTNKVWKFWLGSEIEERNICIQHIILKIGKMCTAWDSKGTIWLPIDDEYFSEEDKKLKTVKICKEQVLKNLKNYWKTYTEVNCKKKRNEIWIGREFGTRSCVYDRKVYYLFMLFVFWLWNVLSCDGLLIVDVMVDWWLIDWFDVLVKGF
jgi:hypothetical protein